MTTGRAIQRLVPGAICLALLGADCAVDGESREMLGYDPEQCHREFGDLLASGDLDALELTDECRLYFGRLLEGPCHDLIAATCGEFDECVDESDCVLARLMAEPWDGEERCQAKLDNGEFTPCTDELQHPCLDLVRHVCGAGLEEDKPCGAHPACVQALYLFESESSLSCEQALREATLYPRCE